MTQSENIKQLAVRAGFDLCGIVPTHHLKSDEQRFLRWLEDRNHSSLGYLERNIDKRFNPALLMPGARSVVVCGVNYKNLYSMGYPRGTKAKIASYALKRDYHTTIKEMLFKFASQLKELYPELRFRAFTDSAPLAEKSLAVEAGLGWIGRQSLLVTPKYGTFVHLAELVIDQECDQYDKPLEGVGCSECRACVRHCPAGAINPNRTIDARRCIACRTIESVEQSDEPLHGWIFGCEECQSCCPHNRNTPLTEHPDFKPIFSPEELPEERWLEMSEEEFSEILGSTPITRSGLERIKSIIKSEK